MNNRNYLIRIFLCVICVVFCFEISCKKLDLENEVTGFNASNDSKSTSSSNSTKSSKKKSKSTKSSSSKDEEETSTKTTSKTEKSSNNSSSEEEDTTSIDMTMKYRMIFDWKESSYGGYEKISNLVMHVTNDSISESYTMESVKCTTGYSNANQVIEKISSTENNEFVRSSTKELKSQKNSDYEDGRGALIFVNSVSSSNNFGDSYNYKFSKPVPLFPRDDLTKSSYKKFASKKYSYSYSFYDSVLGKTIEANMNVKFEVSNATRVTVNFNNVITSSDINDKKLAELYGRLPIVKNMNYSINLNNHKISALSGTGETLVSRFTTSQRYTDGNVATVNVNGKICSYKNGSSKTQSYNCE